MKPFDSWEQETQLLEESLREWDNETSPNNTFSSVEYLEPNYFALPKHIIDHSNDYILALQPLMKSFKGIDTAFKVDPVPSSSIEQENRDTPVQNDQEELAGCLSSNPDTESVVIYNYQQERWMERYQALLNFHVKHGHCNVPYTYKDDPGLVNWVKRQRNQYKCIQQGRRSNLTDERISLLNRIGFFEWNSQEAIWQGNFEKLKQFYATNGHFCVPRTVEKKSLSNWVRRQKRYFVMVKSKDSKLKAESLELYKRRIEKLESIGMKF